MTTAIHLGHATGWSLAGWSLGLESCCAAEARLAPALRSALTQLAARRDWGDLAAVSVATQTDPSRWRNAEASARPAYWPPLLHLVAGTDFQQRQWRGWPFFYRTSPPVKVSTPSME